MDDSEVKLASRVPKGAVWALNPGDRATKESRELAARIGHSTVGAIDDRRVLVKAYGEWDYNKKWASRGGWNGRNFWHGSMVTGTQVHTPKQDSYRGRCIVPRSAGLALISRSPHDIRPHLVSLCSDQSVVSFDFALAYCRRYLASVCVRESLQLRPGVADEIARRALRTWLFDELSAPIDEQRFGLRTLRVHFRRLFHYVLNMLESRMRETLAQLKTVNRAEVGVWRETPNGLVKYYRRKEKSKCRETGRLSAAAIPPCDIPATDKAA